MQNVHLQPIIIRISSFHKAHHSLNIKSCNGRRFGHLGVKSLSSLLFGSDLRGGMDDWRAGGQNEDRGDVEMEQRDCGG